MCQPATNPTPTPQPPFAADAAGPYFPAWLPALLLGLMTIALYWPAMRHDFVNYDDDLYVTDNAQVQAGLTLAGVKRVFFKPDVQFGYWHPLTLLSHMLDCELYGLKPWGHHLTSVLLHALNTVLVFLLLRRLTGATWRSVMVAALFAVHPLHVESVAWVAERKDVLSTCFGLLSLIFYARYVGRLNSDKSRAGIKNAKGKIYYGLALFFFTCGLLSKPMLVTWPFVLLLLDYWPLARCLKKEADSQKAEAGQLSTFNFQPSTVWPLVREKIPFFALVAVVTGLTLVISKEKGTLMTVQNLPMSARAGNALIAYCRYLGKMFWPTKLAVFYPHPGHWPLADELLAAGFLILLSMLFLVPWRQYPFLTMGWLWFVGTMIPVIGLAQVGYFSMADRYTYVSSLGVFIAVIWGVCEFTRGWRYQAVGLSVAGTVTIVLCMMLTRQQLAYWQDSGALFRHTLAVTENNYIAHNNLGEYLFDNKGQADEAINQFQAAIRLRPDYADAYNNLGIALGSKNRVDDAISQFQAAIQLKPSYADAHYDLGVTEDKKGLLDEAINEYRETIRLAPDNANAYNNLGIALARKGQIDEAISEFRAAIRLKPDNAAARDNLARALGMKVARQGGDPGGRKTKANENKLVARTGIEPVFQP